MHDKVSQHWRNTGRQHNINVSSAEFIVSCISAHCHHWTQTNVTKGRVCLISAKIYLSQLRVCVEECDYSTKLLCCPFGRSWVTGKQDWLDNIC